MSRKLSAIFLALLCLTPLAAKKRPQVPDSLQRMTLEVNGVPFTMQRVEGGSFIMGATSDQYDPDTYTDKPAHLVFLSPYYIAATEVTNRLWKAVMPDREMLSPSGYPEHPVSYVNWYDAQEFVRRLESLTGLPFRLPTEAEWEFAARGGDKSKHYRFAGGNCADSVGWTYSCAGQWTHPVARKHPNELGLYDLTGNVTEWCHDIYGPYQLSTTPDPQGADTGAYRIVRGGSYDECIANSHLSVRRWHKPETATSYIGFRVALTLPDDPMKQPLAEEPPLTMHVRLKGRKLHFYLVPGVQPYYISDEISASRWKRIMAAEPPKSEHGAAVGMTRQERVRFAEECSRLANKPLTVATIAETDTALQKGVIAPPKRNKRERSTQAVQRSRRTRAKLSPWTELVGFRLSLPDDPVLLQFKGDYNEKRPLRLVFRAK
ncbi:MAG: SUMF1/EgtB/PvdO family nonheme iron enzyme [Paludibacteraceae bacterium]|nr:SUMF1/EgtB/PvdO family nonheme iron enzyme [Paludibacteraceae bacterium]